MRSKPFSGRTASCGISDRMTSRNCASEWPRSGGRITPIREAQSSRPTPKKEEHPRLVFLTRSVGQPVLHLGAIHHVTGQVSVKWSYPDLRWEVTTSAPPLGCS